MTAKKRQVPLNARILGKAGTTDLIQRVATNVKYYRLKAKISQERLEYETGLTVSRYESGKHDMTLTTLSILSEALDVKPVMLIK